MTADDVFAAFEAGFARRKFSAGLLVAFVRFFRRFDALDGCYSSLDAFLVDHPRQTTIRGARANTLVVTAPSGDPVSLRPFYNEAERLFRSEHKRFDYPNCAPHATQAWTDYRDWIDAVLSMPETAADLLERRVVETVLRRLPSHAIDPDALAPLARPFTNLLDGFDLTAQQGEPRGGAFQGIVYAFVRADAPHLHLEVAKVGAGGKRLQRIGDIDGWEGERLILSAEVKHYAIDPNAARELVPFAGEVAARKAMGLIVAEAFTPEGQEEVEALGLKAVSAADLRRIVDLWDPLKQRVAAQSVAYYVHHVEKNAALMARLAAWNAR